MSTALEMLIKQRMTLPKLARMQRELSEQMEPINRIRAAIFAQTVTKMIMLPTGTMVAPIYVFEPEAEDVLRQCDELQQAFAAALMAQHMTNA